MVSCTSDVSLADVALASSKEPVRNLPSLGKELNSVDILALVCRGYLEWCWVSALKAATERR